MKQHWHGLRGYRAGTRRIRLCADIGGFVMTSEIGNSQLLRTWANDGTIVQPPNTKQDEGWLRGEQPPHEWMNWLQNTFGQKINHILSRGVPDWSATTQYTAGASVNRSGATWVAAATNTNSEPTDVNANWVRSADRSEFTQQVASSGYQTLPGGLIIQWGTGTLPSSGGSSASVSVTWPIAFPNNLFHAAGSARGTANSSTGGLPAVGANAGTLTGGTFTGDTLGWSNFNRTVLFDFFAIGN
jgi:hypothetical protein